MLREMIVNIPSFFFIQKLGFFDESNVNSIEWYISVMLFSMLLLYPLLRRNYSLFVHVLAPAFALGTLGWMTHTYHSLTEVSVWTGLCFKSMLRGNAEIALGTTAFEITRTLDQKALNKAQKVFLSLLEGAFLFLSVLFMAMTVSDHYQVFCLAPLFVLVVLAFSSQTACPEIFTRPVVFYLGRLSLPLYLVQLFSLNMTVKLLGGIHQPHQIAAYVMITLGSAMILLPAGTALSKRIFPPKASH